MARTISDIQVPNRSPTQVWPVLTSWLGSNGFTILTPRSDGNQQVVSHWDGALLIRPRAGSCVALKEMTGGGTIVFEVGLTQTTAGTTIAHLEGYVTGRGPGWKGKEYDLIPKNLAIAGILRKRGLLLMEDLQKVLLSRAAVSIGPTGPLRSSDVSAVRGLVASPTCARCGNSNSPGAQFCSSCGFPINQMSPSPAPLPLVATPLPHVPAPAPLSAAPVSSGGLGGPSLPMLPGETLVGQFASSPEGQQRVVSFNMLVMLAIMVGILLPFVGLTLLTAPVRPILLIFLFPVVLILGMSLYVRRTIGRKGPTRVFVTNRRLIVDQPGKEESASMTLENVGQVEVSVDSRAVRRAGVAWVYVLPMGTPKAIVGGGRARHVASGVLWVPAVPLDSANNLRSLVISSARDVQGRLGYPPSSMAE